MSKTQIINETPEETSYADSVISYEDMMKDLVFLGDVPFQSIVEGLITQFQDYINLEDRENYVDIFYEQLAESYAAIDDEEDHPSEVREILDAIRDKFVDLMADLFNTKLTITIMMIENEEIDQEELEVIIRKLYTYFILDARKNFKNVIYPDACQRMKRKGIDVDNPEYMKSLEDIMNVYSPIIVTILPTDFLKTSGEDTILSWYNDGIISGNFLRKYSPRFFKNEEYKIELINDIIIGSQFHHELNTED